ncbi:MAG: sulfur oxidation c-type cytochrome SoxA [Gammaproteobacteria bacterium]|nr:sulfur oxidation c-type cytochrome SoxA [Gammaproteobacteria bacterium]MCW8922868.1 sulfur oxidation c-type cytochrome SoxA [Gammaproteobacteria bacterium]
MKKYLAALSVVLMIATPVMAQASPDSDLKSFRAYYANKFPEVPMNDYVNGVYAVDQDSRDQWEQAEEFPDYEAYVDKGDELFHKKFANGKSFVDCFPDYEKGVKQNYPYFDEASSKVVTLEGDINACLKANGEKAYRSKKGKIAYVGAYLAYMSRGNLINVKTPSTPKALAAYNRGKKHFYAKRGQLNLSCADCHYTSASSRIRADILSPALGHPSGFPVYRNKWASSSPEGDGMGTLHRRFAGCNNQVRAKPFKAQSDEYKALEYFLTYMSNGLEINGPSLRK